MNDPLITKYHNTKEQLNRMKEQAAKSSGKIENYKEELDKLGFDTIESAIIWLGKAKNEEQEFSTEIENLTLEAERLLR